jgi:hypothetical protein
MKNGSDVGNSAKCIVEKIWIAVGHSDEYGPVVLPAYAASREADVYRKIDMFDGRRVAKELGWDVIEASVSFNAGAGRIAERKEDV